MKTTLVDICTEGLSPTALEAKVRRSRLYTYIDLPNPNLQCMWQEALLSKTVSPALALRFEDSQEQREENRIAMLTHKTMYL